MPSVLRVLVVCGAPDPALGRLSGLTLVPDPGLGLNGAIRAGDASARSRWPHAGVATCPADLPALDPGELESVLSLCLEWPRSVVPDHQGTGTTLLASRRDIPLGPRFGPGSYRAHLADGATAVPVAPTSTLRRDVDRLEDLEAILRSSPRSRTAQVVREVGTSVAVRRGHRRSSRVTSQPSCS